HPNHAVELKRAPCGALFNWWLASSIAYFGVRALWLPQLDPVAAEQVQHGDKRADIHGAEEVRDREHPEERLERARVCRPHALNHDANEGQPIERALSQCCDLVEEADADEQQARHEQHDEWDGHEPPEQLVREELDRVKAVAERV